MTKLHNIKKLLSDYLYCEQIEYSTQLLSDNTHIEYSKFHVKFLQPNKLSKEFVLCASNGKLGRCTNARKYGGYFCHHHVKKDTKVVNYTSNSNLFKSIHGNPTEEHDVGELIGFIDLLHKIDNKTFHDRISKYAKRNKLLPLVRGDKPDIEMETMNEYFEIVREKRKQKNYINTNKCLAVTVTGRQCGNNAYRKDFCTIHRTDKAVRYSDYLIKELKKEAAKEKRKNEAPTCLNKWTVMKGELNHNKKMVFRLHDSLFEANDTTVKKL